jgi:hypothetical protein
MPQAPLDMLRLEFDLLKNGGVGLESDERSIGLVGHFAFLFILELALLKGGLDKFAFTKTSDEELF